MQLLVRHEWAVNERVEGLPDLDLLGILLLHRVVLGGQSLEFFGYLLGGAFLPVVGTEARWVVGAVLPKQRSARWLRYSWLGYDA